MEQFKLEEGVSRSEALHFISIFAVIVPSLCLGL
jgi:hypothetical protein